MTMQDFIGRLRAGPENDVYMTANNSASNKDLVNELLPTLPNMGPAEDPWLNLESMATRAFIWIGTKGTWTPLHHDQTNNGLVQISGRKKVWLAPTTSVTHIANHHHVYSQFNPRAPDYVKFPLAQSIKWIEVELGPGDALFIPQGWWHAVLGLEENVSVSWTCWREKVTDYSVAIS